MTYAERLAERRQRLHHEYLERLINTTEAALINLGVNPTEARNAAIHGVTAIYPQTAPTPPPPRTQRGGPMPDQPTDTHEPHIGANCGPTWDAAVHAALANLHPEPDADDDESKLRIVRCIPAPPEDPALDW